MICFILIGCSKKTDNNIKNETNNSVNNNETVEENETIEENATYVNFQGEDIDINSNSDKSRKVSIINDMNIFALDNYEKDSFKKIIVVKDNLKPWRTNDGILVMGILDFLMDLSSLDR